LPTNSVLAEAAVSQIIVNMEEQLTDEQKAEKNAQVMAAMMVTPLTRTCLLGR
jgi:hypothetical protein